MKKNVLLVDESLTVQKVVALTLDRQKYTIQNAKSRSEAMKVILESPPDVILVSDQVASVNATAFPGEVETWTGKDRAMPPLILITSQDISEFGRYTAVLKKPFSPQALQSIVQQHAAVTENTVAGITVEALREAPPEREGRLQKIFHEKFNDEADLVRQTFENDFEPEENAPVNTRTRPETAAELWGVADPKAYTQRDPEPGLQVMGAEDSMAYKASLDNQLERFLRSQDLEALVTKVIEKIVPPIVEKVARDRIEKLLKEDGSFMDLK